MFLKSSEQQEAPSPKYVVTAKEAYNELPKEKDKKPSYL